MTLQVPRPPDAELLTKDPDKYARDLRDFLVRLVAELERESRENKAPAKAVIAVSNVAASTTTLDAGTATLTDTLNFIGGLVDTMIGRGFLRTKAGAE